MMDLQNDPEYRRYQELLQRKQRLAAAPEKKAMPEPPAQNTMEGSQPQAETSPGKILMNTAIDSAKNFGNAMIHGRSIGEHMPFGETIGNAGTALGNALVAATTKGPGETFGSVYDQLAQRSDADLAKQKAADAASPLATITKSTLAGLPIGVMKSATAAAPAVEAVEETVKQAPGWLSKGSKYSTNPIGSPVDPEKMALLKEKLAGANAGEASAGVMDPGRMGKMKDWLKARMAKEAYDMLPYVARKGIDVGKAVAPHLPESVMINASRAMGPAHGLFETWLDDRE